MAASRTSEQPLTVEDLSHRAALHSQNWNATFKDKEPDVCAVTLAIWSRAVQVMRWSATEGSPRCTFSAEVRCIASTLS
eukprot:1074081-Amphidinium_carterae.1